jgi:hypothetical protein
MQPPDVQRVAGQVPSASTQPASALWNRCTRSLRSSSARAGGRPIFIVVPGTMQKLLSVNLAPSVGSYRCPVRRHEV